MSRSDRSEESIFLAALEKKGRSEREAFVAAACGGDAGLLARVGELLAAHDDDSGPLDATLPGLHSAPQKEQFEQLGTQIGPYKLLQVIGEGGMGVVYMASQREPVERRVALKIIKPGMDTRQVIARFEAERQALALMDHPNIARVLDGGTLGEMRNSEFGMRNEETGAPASIPHSAFHTPNSAASRPYFVMELVKGVPITQYCDEHHLTARQRLELFVPVCQAIQHAHQKGIIHRDIKPTNILVAEYDQQPVPKIIDFGVAKAIGQRLTEKTMFTEFGQVVGTIEYMSPEQAKLNQLDIDTRTDIYSLGVLLYELLSGETPFDRQRLRSAAFDEVLRIIREEEPPRPSTRLSSSHSLPSIAASRHTEPRQLTSQLRGELDWIVMKALEKDRNRRYETANGLAMDLVRYLHDEPVLACPPSAGYRLSKFARRNRRTLVTAALFTVLLFGAMTAIASIGGWALRDRAAQRAATAQQIALDRAERRSVLEREIEAALGEVALAYSHDRLAEAIAMQRRAASLWASGAADAQLKQRIDQWRADLQMAQRLDEIRLEQSAVKDGHYDREGADAAYREAFRQYGLNSEVLAPQTIATRIATSTIKDRLVPALDDWLDARFAAGLSGAKTLLETARLVDGDPWRNRLRAATLTQDRQTLNELAAESDVLDHPASSLTLLAALLRSTGQLPTAIELLERAQQQYPVDFWINQNLAFYLMQLPSPPAEKAIGYYRAAVALRPASPGVHINLGNALRRLNRAAEAEREIRAAIGLKPDYVEAYMNLGLVLEDQGRTDETERVFMEALRLRPNYVNALLGLGRTYLAHEQLVEAEFVCRSAVGIDPTEPRAQSLLGNLLIKLDRYAEAESAFRTAVERDGKLARYHQDLGVALRLQGKLDEAVEEFREALRLDPRLGQSRADLSAVRSSQRTPAEVEADFRTRLQREAGNAGLHQAFGDYLSAQGKDAAAVVEYREAVRLNPTNAYARSRLTSTLSKLGKVEELEALHQELVRTLPDDFAVHLDYGNFLSNRGKNSEAEQELRTALRLSPAEIGPRVQLGKVLLSLNKAAEAVQELQAAVAAQPKQAGLHVEYARALIQYGKRDEGVAEFREAVRLSPNVGWMWTSLADAAKASAPAEAEAAYREGLRLDPKNIGGRQNFAYFLLGQNRLSEAEAEFRENLRRAPNNQFIRQQLIELLRKQNRLAEVEATYRDAVAQQPQDFARYSELSNFLLSQQRPVDAERVLRDAVAALPESAVARDKLASFLASQGQSQDAEAELRQAVRLNPNDAALQFRLANALRQRGQLQDAVQAAQEAARLNPNELTYGQLHADVLQQLGKLDDAAVVLRRLADLRPEDCDAMLRLARLRNQQKKPDDAEAAFREAIRRSPQQPAPYLELSGMLRGNSKPAAAEAILRELLRIVPGSASGHGSLGSVLNQLGQYAEAEAEFRQALSLNPDAIGLHDGLATSLERLERAGEALAAYQEAVRRQPSEAYVHQHFGNFLLKQGQYQEAEAELAEAAKLRPQDAGIKNSLATARTKVKLAADEAGLRAAVNEKPDDHEARSRLATALLGLDKFAEAETELRRAIRLAPNQPSNHRALAKALQSQGKLVEAQSEFREVVRLEPLVARSHFDLGNLTGRLAQWKEAEASCVKVTELQPENHLAWYGVTVLRLEMGDVEGYRQASRGMLARFDRPGQSPEVWERTAKTCLLTADGAGELQRAVALADRAVTGTEKHGSYWYFQFTKGLAEYRSGRFAEALPWLEKFTGRLQTPGPREAFFAPHSCNGHALVALTQHRLGQGEKAAAALRAAEELIARWMPDGTVEHPFENNWDDWLRARMFVREAQKVLPAEGSTAPPATAPNE